MRIAGATITSLLFAVALPAQTVVVTTTAGATIEARVLGMLGAGAEANLRIEADGKQRSLPLTRVVGLHGPAPAAGTGTTVHLVGGDQLRGDIQGGDLSGESFTLRSTTLGQLTLPVDRLRAIVFSAQGDADLDLFRLPAGSDWDEALFRKARRGYDTIVGATHRFTASGVLFEWPQEPEPRLFEYRSLAAFALRGGLPREGAATAQLITRGGDVLSVDLVDVEDDRFVFLLEGERRLEMGIAQIASLAFYGGDRRFLSDLEPESVVEQGSPFDEKSAPLYRFRRDRAATGGFLIVKGATHGKGLGVHSRCLLRYRVPSGFTKFLCHVGVDDEVLQTPVRGVALVQVSADETVVWGPAIVRSGEAAHPLGVVAVQPGSLLTLEVDFGDGWFVGDRVDWLSPVFLK